jgi:hypothetical protein
MFIPYPGSEFFPSWIPDLNFFRQGSRIRIKIKFFYPKKWFLSSRKYDSGCSSRIQILTYYLSRIPDPGVKKAYLVLPSSVLEKTSVAGLPSAPSRSSCSNCSQNPACKYKHHLKAKVIFQDSISFNRSES